MLIRLYEIESDSVDGIDGKFVDWQKNNPTFSVIDVLYRKDFAIVVVYIDLAA